MPYLTGAVYAAVSGVQTPLVVTIEADKVEWGIVPVGDGLQIWEAAPTLRWDGSGAVVFGVVNLDHDAVWSGLWPIPRPSPLQPGVQLIVAVGGSAVVSENLCAVFCRTGRAGSQDAVVFYAIAVVVQPITELIRFWIN